MDTKNGWTVISRRNAGAWGKIWRTLAVLTMVAGLIGPVGNSATTRAQNNCRTFTETKQQVCGRFLEYWDTNGGLAQQGLPLSPEMDVVSSVNGKTYKTQWFERAVFELHSENQKPYD